MIQFLTSLAARWRLTALQNIKKIKFQILPGDVIELLYESQLNPCRGLVSPRLTNLLAFKARDTVS